MVICDEVSIYQEDVAILNEAAPNNRAPKYRK